MKFIETLNELAAKVGLGKVELDDTGSVTLLFDGVYAISFTPDAAEDAVYFQCEIADASSLSHGDSLALLEASLSATNGAAFSIDRPLEKVVPWKRFGEFASCAALEKAINEFLGQIVRWKERLERGGASAAGERRPAAPAPTVLSGGFIPV